MSIFAIFLGENARVVYHMHTFRSESFEACSCAHTYARVFQIADECCKAKLGALKNHIQFPFFSLINRSRKYKSFVCQEPIRALTSHEYLTNSCTFKAIKGLIEIGKGQSLSRDSSKKCLTFI